MNPTVKKVVTAVAVKKGIDQVQKWRRPKKRSLAARFGRKGLVVAAGGAVAYLAATGRLQRMLDQVRGRGDVAQARSPSWSGPSTPTPASPAGPMVPEASSDTPVT